MDDNNAIRELTRSELRDTRRLVTTMCANYDHEYGCLPLETGCFMLGKAYAGGALCKYFKAAVLPLNPELEAVFCGQPKAAVRICTACGKNPVPIRGRAKYCVACAQKIHRRQKTESERKRRLGVDK
ncbi:cysteine-rich VLP domain-containing protein [Ruminococcaceae bacterium OttesenSCG-928-L11]|nr:cysteine-rich VLP domain-containing protein [Ruminococcaceae bacterium OttesenSCG-928-L11]